MQIYIDGFHLFSGARTLEKEIDYIALIDAVAPDGVYHKIRFYTEVDSRNERQKKFLTWLQTNGFCVIAEPLKKGQNNEVVHVSLASAISTDMVLAAHNGEREMILIAGMSELAYVVKKLSDLSVRIELVSFKDLTSYELASNCDEITDLATLEVFKDREPTD